MAPVGYGPAYQQNDVVGCGWNSRTKEVFFTKNGEYLGALQEFE
jgi:hypothetical protein